MQESVTCPSCLARYGLRAERISPGIRRAQCFKCSHIFNIEVEVSRILRPPQFYDDPAPISHAEPAACRIEAPAPTLLEPTPFTAEQDHQESYQDEITDLTNIPDLDESSLMLGDIDESLLAPPKEQGVQPKEQWMVPEPPAMPQAQWAEAPAPTQVPTPPAMQAPAPPSAPPSAPEQPKAEADEVRTSYASAKDAISKLLGNTPEPPPPDRRPLSKGGSAMDVEATLDALENTLGGAQPKDLSATVQPPAQPLEATSSLGTVKLSNEDIKAAMAAGQEARTPPREATAPIAKFQQPAVPPPPPPPAEDLLRVKVGSDLYQNLTQEKLISMIEEGRVHDWNLVARQQGERWIEAGKIPSLRPTFENMKRNAEGDGQSASIQSEPAPQKRSLFGGLFGRH